MQPASSGLDEAGRPKVELTIDPDFRPHSPIDGFTETSVVRARDSSLLAVLRQQGVGGDETTKLYSARSTDGGRTWNAPALVGFTGMSPVLHAVDDVLLLGTRRRYPNADGGEPGVEVRLSRTCGQSWSEPVLLVDPHGTRYSAEYQCGYPAMVTTDGDRVLVLFYGFTPSGRRYVASNVIRISPLRNKEPVDAEGPSRHSAQ